MCVLCEHGPAALRSSSPTTHLLEGDGWVAPFARIERAPSACARSASTGTTQPSPSLLLFFVDTYPRNVISLDFDFRIVRNLHRHGFFPEIGDRSPDTG